MAGVFGYTFGPEGKTDLGRVLDRQSSTTPAPLPATADGLDEIVLAVPRDTPLRFDPTLGFHLYGADICLSARRQGLPVAVLDAPCLHNSLFAYLSPEFHTPASSSWPSGPTSGPSTAAWVSSTPWQPQPVPGTLGRRPARALSRLEHELAGARAELDDRRRHIANMEASVFWRLRDLTHRVLRRP